MLAEWRDGAASVRVTQRCLSRDAWRVVLERGGERLYLSESDGTPVMLARVEPHYLWGQVRADYLWTTWWNVNGLPALPGISLGFLLPNADLLRQRLRRPALEH